MNGITNVENHQFMDLPPGQTHRVNIGNCDVYVSPTDSKVNLTHDINPAACDYYPSTSCVIVSKGQEVDTLVTAFPAIRNLYANQSIAIETDEASVILTVPTATGLDQFRDQYPIELQPPLRFQSFQHPASMPVAEYLEHINQNIFPLSNGAEFYMHDVIAHALGAMAVQPEPLEVFKALVRDAADMKSADIPAAAGYQAALGDAIDGFTDINNFRNRFELGEFQYRNKSLLNLVAEYMNYRSYSNSQMRSLEIESRVLAIMRELGGATVLEDDNSSFRTLKPKFVQNLMLAA